MATHGAKPHNLRWSHCPKAVRDKKLKCPSSRTKHRDVVDDGVSLASANPEDLSNLEYIGSCEPSVMMEEIPQEGYLRNVMGWTKPYRPFDFRAVTEPWDFQAPE